MSLPAETTRPRLEAFEAPRPPRSDNGERDPGLLKLHSALTSIHPCLSSYPPGDPGVDLCPWSDGPLIENVGSETAVLGLNGEHLEVLPLVVESATVIGLPVLDPQTGLVHCPLWVHPSQTSRVRRHPG